MLHKIYISNKCCPFEHQRILKWKMYYSFHKKYYCQPHISMITVGSFDTKNTGAKAAENSALHHKKKLHFKIFVL